MIIQQEKQIKIKQITCIDYLLSLLGRRVGLLLTRSQVLGNEAYENRNGFLIITKIISKKQSELSDVANRFKTHIKCGLGVDTPPASATKLYKAMQGSSLWYWTFELIEKCPSSKLNQREKYWINFYQSDKIGLNSTKGNK